MSSRLTLGIGLSLRMFEDCRRVNVQAYEFGVPDFSVLARFSKRMCHQPAMTAASSPTRPAILPSAWGPPIRKMPPGMIKSSTVATKTTAIRPRVFSLLGLLTTRYIAATIKRIPNGLAAGDDCIATPIANRQAPISEAKFFATILSSCFAVKNCDMPDKCRCQTCKYQERLVRQPDLPGKCN